MKGSVELAFQNKERLLTFPRGFTQRLGLTIDHGLELLLCFLHELGDGMNNGLACCGVEVAEGGLGNFEVTGSMEEGSRGEEENQSDQNEEVHSSTRRSGRSLGLHRARSHGEGGEVGGEEEEEGRGRASEPKKVEGTKASEGREKGGFLGGKGCC